VLVGNDTLRAAIAFDAVRSRLGRSIALPRGVSSIAQANRDEIAYISPVSGDLEFKNVRTGALRITKVPGDSVLRRGLVQADCRKRTLGLPPHNDAALRGSSQGALALRGPTLRVTRPSRKGETSGTEPSAPVAEMPIAPAIFDAYRWGYIGAGVNAQLFERPLLSGAHRLLSPINENLGALLEHVDRVGNKAIAPWLGLYGFGGIVADDASNPAIFSPAQGGNAPPPSLPRGRIVWHDDGLRYVAFDDRVVNPALYVARTEISGATTEAEIGLTCLALNGCKSIAFVTGNRAEAGKRARAYIFRRPLLWTTRLAATGRESRLRVFVDDAVRTDDLSDGSGPSDRQTVFPTRPAIVRISERGAFEPRADAVVTGPSAITSRRRFCARPNVATEMSVAPNDDARGLGLLAVTYESDRGATADLLVVSRAGTSETRLRSGASRESIVRTLPLDSGTRARIVLEAQPIGTCVELEYFAFARLRSTSDFARTRGALRGEPTLYQRLNPSPLQEYTAAATIGLSAHCDGICASDRSARPHSTLIPMHTIAPGIVPIFEPNRFANEACSRDRHAIFRGEGIRLIPGLRYVAHVIVRTGAPAHVRTAILTEDEFGIAESATEVAGGNAQPVELPFAAPNSVADAVVYAWVDTPSQDPRACILSTAIEVDSPNTILTTDSEALWQGEWHATTDGSEHYRISLKGLGGSPALVVLNQTYDDRWQLKTNAQATSAHVVVNGGVNGWVVTGHGDADIVLRYAGADVTKWALIWGALSTLASIGLACWYGRRVARSGKHEDRLAAPGSERSPV
jgi:hypothetical protein